MGHEPSRREGGDRSYVARAVGTSEPSRRQCDGSGIPGVDGAIGYAGMACAARCTSRAREGLKGTQARHTKSTDRICRNVRGESAGASAKGAHATHQLTTGSRTWERAWAGREGADRVGAVGFVWGAGQVRRQGSLSGRAWAPWEAIVQSTCSAEGVAESDGG